MRISRVVAFSVGVLLFGILLSSAVAAQDIFEAIGTIFGGDDLGEIYENNGLWIDLIIYLFLFINVATVAFRGREGFNKIAMVMGVVLAVSATVFESTSGIRLGALGPFAFGFLLLLIVYAVYRSVHSLGLTSGKAAAFAYLIGFGLIGVVAPNLLPFVRNSDNVFLRTMYSIGQLLLLVAIVAIIWSLISFVRGERSPLSRARDLLPGGDPDVEDPAGGPGDDHPEVPVVGGGSGENATIIERDTDTVMPDLEKIENELVGHAAAVERKEVPDLRYLSQLLLNLMTIDQNIHDGRTRTENRMTDEEFTESASKRKAVHKETARVLGLVVQEAISSRDLLKKDIEVIKKEMEVNIDQIIKSKTEGDLFTKYEDSLEKMKKSKNRSRYEELSQYRGLRQKVEYAKAAADGYKDEAEKLKNEESEDYRALRDAVGVAADESKNLKLLQNKIQSVPDRVLKHDEISDLRNEFHKAYKDLRRVVRDTQIMQRIGSEKANIERQMQELSRKLDLYAHEVQKAANDMPKDM